LKKYATHFFSHAFGATGEKEAANPVTGLRSTTNAKVLMFINLIPGDFRALILIKTFAE